MSIDHRVVAIKTRMNDVVHIFIDCGKTLKKIELYANRENMGALRETEGECTLTR